MVPELDLPAKRHGAADSVSTPSASHFPNPPASAYDELNTENRMGMCAMRLGMLLKYKGEAGGPDMDVVLEAERLGFDSVWSGESWGVDTVTPLTWVLARLARKSLKAGTARSLVSR